MRPILYQGSEKAFVTNGIGILTDALSCYVDHGINSVLELELQYPVKGIHFFDIVEHAVILASTGPSSAPQPFRVYNISEPMGGNVTVKARHVVYDLAGIPIDPFKAESAAEAMAFLSQNAVVACPFAFEAGKNASGTMTVDAPTDAWSLLGSSSGSILAAYGGEYEFDRFTVRLRERLGEDRGVSIRYGKNLTSVTQDRNCGNVYTGIYPYWKGQEGNFVTLTEKVVLAEGTFDHVRILTVDMSSFFESQPTETQLRARAERYIRDHEVGVPEISWTVSYVQLGQTEEYKNLPLMEEIQLGDTVTVIFQKMGINVTSRVIKTRWNVLYSRHESISLGRVKKTISDTIARQSREVSRIGGGLAKAETEIQKTRKVVYGIRQDTDECIANIGDVKSGLYAIASADDIEGLKEGKTTLFAQIYDNLVVIYAGLESRVTSEEFGEYVDAQNELKVEVAGAKASLTQKASKAEVEGLDGRMQAVEEATTSLTAEVGTTKASLELKAEKSTVTGLGKSVADLQADVVKINGVFAVTDAQVTAIRQLVAADGFQIGKSYFYLYGKKIEAQTITLTNGSATVLGY